MENPIKKFIRSGPLVIGVILLIIIILSVHRFFSHKEYSKQHPNILLILMDANRPDHLGCYGYKEDTSPNIDAIAMEGVLFTDCYTVAPWTDPVLVSLFTGLYPQSVFPPNPFSIAHKRMRLPHDIDTLADILHDNGYHTAALIDHSALGKELGYDHGFEEYICNQQGLYKGLYFIKSSNLKDLWKQVVALFKKYENEKFFIYLHLMYSHQPYTYRGPDGKITMLAGWLGNQNIENRDKMIMAYDSGVRRNDAIIGGIFRHLKRTSLADNTYIIIMADHGEAFYEHNNWQHGSSLYNELLRIPLVIYPAGDKRIEGLRIGGVASDIDIFPTILDMAGVRKPRTFDGISLLPYMREGKHLPNRLVFSESPHSNNINAISCEDGRYKLIYSPSKGTRASYLTMLKDVIAGKNCQLYDLLNDPHETVNIASKEHFKTFMFGSHIIFHKIRNDRRRSKIHQETVHLTDNDLRRLRSLGYVQ